MRGACFAASMALLGSALLAGCTVNQPAPEISVLDDNFRPYREFATRERTSSSYPDSVTTRLVARVDRKTGDTVMLLGVAYSYRDAHLRKYESARNARAETLSAIKGQRHRACGGDTCRYDEELTIAIPEAELRSAPASGYQLKIFARSGNSKTLTVAKEDIDRLFASISRPNAEMAATNY